MRKLTYTLQPEDDYFVAQCRELDVASDGLTELAAVAALQEALELFFGSLGGFYLEPAIDTASRHVTPAGGNVFADLGFSAEEAAVLKEDSDQRKQG